MNIWKIACIYSSLRSVLTFLKVNIKFKLE